MVASRKFNIAAQHGIPPEAIDEFLKIAAAGSNMALLGMIDKHGQKLLETRNAEGATALVCAAETGHSGAILLLIRSGAEVDAINDRGDTALMVAVRKGFTTVAEMLLDKGADVDAFNRRGESVLHAAATHRDNTDRKHPMSKKKKEAVKLVLDRGARIDATDNRGNTPEDLARKYGYDEVADMITAEHRRRHDFQTAQMSLFHDGLPDDITVSPLRLRHPNRNFYRFR